MDLSNQNSGILLVKKAKLSVFKRTLVKTAKKLREKRAEDRKYRSWKYIAERVRELRG